MYSRRTMLAMATASLAVTSRLGAQVLPPSGFATPAGTSPFAPDVYRERRRRVMEKLQDGVAVVYGADAVESDAAVVPPFVQNGDFAWLTGIVDEPGAILIMAPTERTFREWLFLPSRNPEVERWEVERLPLGTLLEHRTGFARVMRTGKLNELVTELTGRSKTLHFLGPIVPASAPKPKALDLYGKVMERVPGTSIKDDSALLPSLRIVKEPRELDMIRRATRATAMGHIAAMKQVRPGWSEAQLKAALENGFRSGGGDGLSYDSIVATSRNAASLHYTGGTGVIGANDLILIDAAASVGGYASDITRTFPASGRFSPEQRDLYNLVLAAQAAAVAKLKAGAYFEDLMETSKDVFRKAGRVDDFYHSLGHFVGLDVHDVGDYSKPLPAGAVITMEPGLYVQSANYGIRIEDLYLVTPTGSQWLSEGIPRTIDEIEAVMAR